MKRIALGLIGAALLGSVAWAANLPLFTGPTTQEPNQTNATENQLIQNLNGAVNSSSMAPWAMGRNFLDNGDMWVDIRGTTASTCANYSLSENAYSADRWGCMVGVAAGVGTLQVATSSPTPPLQFVNEEKLVRATGVLTTPICAYQEVPTVRAASLQGRNVILSAWEQNLGGLAADNGGQFNMYIFTGTGTDQGLQSWTATAGGSSGNLTNQITPAWTGVISQNTTLGTIPYTLSNNTFNANTSWQRYNTGPILMPINETEIAVAVCFVPTATGASSTDGIAFTGVQLEQSDPNNAFGPGTYEFKNPMEETAEANRYAYTLPEALVSVNQVVGYAASTNGCVMALQFPVPMIKAPTLTSIGTAIGSGTWKIDETLSLQSISTFSANTNIAASFWGYTAAGALMVNSQACTLNGQAGGGILFWGADF